MVFNAAREDAAIGNRRHRSRQLPGGGKSLTSRLQPGDFFLQQREPAECLAIIAAREREAAMYADSQNGKRSILPVQSLRL